MSFGDRLKIAQWAAQGLLYLHTFATPPIVHRDIKPANLLLGKDLIVSGHITLATSPTKTRETYVLLKKVSEPRAAFKSKSATHATAFPLLTYFYDGVGDKGSRIGSEVHSSHVPRCRVTGEGGGFRFVEAPRGHGDGDDHQSTGDPWVHRSGVLQVQPSHYQE